MGLRDVKKELNKMDKSEMIKLFSEMYSKIPSAKEFLDIFSGVKIETLIEKYIIMDDFIEEVSEGGSVVWTKKVELEDGTSIMTKVEKVENGYIKCVDKSIKEEDGWKFESKKTIHTENPLQEKSLIQKLAEALKD